MRQSGSVQISSDYSVMPTLDFAHISSKTNDNDDSFDSTESEFDVYAAAKRQSRHRASVIYKQSENDENMTENVASNTRNAVKNRLSKKPVSKVFRATTTTTRNVKSKIQSTTGPNFSKSNVVIKTTASSKKVIVTKPKTVNFTVSKRLSMNPPKKNGLTSEELEFQRVEEEKRREQELMAMHKKAYHDLRVKPPPAPANHSSKELTIPKSPYQRLRTRLGTKIYSNSVPKSPEEEPAPLPLPVGPTNIKPFQFETEKRARIKGIETVVPSSQTPRITFAEIEMEVQGSLHCAPPPIPSGPRKLTEPKTPTLLTKRRAETDQRNIIKSHDELEQELMDEFQKNPFKAKKVDKRIFESEPVGIHSVPVRPLTEPMPFELRIDKRSANRTSITPIAPPITVEPFKALPLPTFSPRPVSPRPPRSNKKLTQPESPHFHGRERASTAPAHRQKPHHSEVEKRRAMELESFKHSLSSNVGSNVVTQPVEFHFRTAERSRTNKITQEQDKHMDIESREIKAKPAPKVKPPPSIAPSTKSLTTVQEFSLRSASRHAMAQSAFQKQVEEKLTSETKVKPFKARPVPKSVATTYAVPTEQQAKKMEF